MFMYTFSCSKSRLVQKLTSSSLWVELVCSGLFRWANSQVLAHYALSVFADEVGCRSVIRILPGSYLRFIVFIHICQTSRNYKIFDFLP